MKKSYYSAIDKKSHLRYQLRFAAAVPEQIAWLAAMVFVIAATTVSFATELVTVPPQEVFTMH